MKRLVPVSIALLLSMPGFADDHGGWMQEFRNIDVPPIKRADTTQLIDAGVVRADGFNEIVVSLVGEFKKGVAPSGSLGVVLIPDTQPFTFLLRNEGRFVFPLEVRASTNDLGDELYFDAQATFPVAFARYRVYLYNQTESSANVGVFVYRRR